MNSAARAQFRQRSQAQREALRPGSIVLKLAGQTSGSIVAAVEIKGIILQTNEQTGQVSRIQPCTVDVRKALLPVWATEDSLPTKGKLVAGGKTFKISAARDMEPNLHLVALRWPNDDD